MNKTRQVTLSFNNGQYLVHLYVTPKSIQISRPQNTRKYIGIGGEEINLSAGQGLRRVLIQALLPQSPTFGSTNDVFYTPDETIAMLKKWQDTRLPMRLVISGSDVNDAFLIEDISQRFNEGDKDIYLSLTLCQYRFIKAEINITGIGADTLNSRDTTKSIPKTHIVKQGDTLWAISKMYYGTPNRWHELQVKNSIRDVRKLQIGTVIQL